ncbi:MAG: FtsX-like permease family protein, partial [Desulfobacterales bacterium]|nr:FtsX-like permease family protein [Desulfobacterales bacterium]
VIGLEVNPYNRRNDEGKYVIWDPWMGEPMSLTVLPITERGAVVDPKPRVFAAVNEFHTGWYEMDSKRVYVPFDVLQEMLLMGEAEQVDPDDPTVVIGTAPARAFGIIVRAVEGVSAEELRDAIAKRYAAFQEAHPDLPPEPFMSIYTWRQKLRNLLDTVENEKNLMTFLFSIVSVVSILLILAIFYMIVLEKTRDIGILRALGASRMGVASIFLVYAGVIGAIGTTAGTVIAYFIVTYINELHAWLGRAFGIVIWDRRVYFFENIPSRLDPTEVGVIAVAAVVAAVCGAILPAMMAARVDPVESLRYE